MPTSHPPRRARETTSAACPWRARVWQEYRAGNLTRAERDALLTLATYRGAGGIATPSHATLAERSKTSPRTVQRALDAARRLGLVRSQERRRRNGWRWLRTSDAHRLTVPEIPTQPGQCPRYRPARTNRQPGGGGEIKESQKAALAQMMAEAAAGPDLLALRRQQIEARLVAERAGRLAGRVAA